MKKTLTIAALLLLVVLGLTAFQVEGTGTNRLNLQTGGSSFGGTTSFQTLYTFDIPAHALDTPHNCISVYAQFHQSGTSAAGSYIWNVGASATQTITINANLSQISSEILICETGTNAQTAINTYNLQATTGQALNPPLGVTSATSSAITVNIQAKCTATCASTTFNPDAFFVFVIRSREQ